MNAETIKALKESHPGLFAAKRAAGLSDAQAAEVIASQLEQDKLNSPARMALEKARSLADLARARFEQLKQLFVEACAAVELAADANPDLKPSQLPSIPALVLDSSYNEDYKAKCLQIADLGSQVAILKEELTIARKRIEELETLLKEKEPLAVPASTDGKTAATPEDQPDPADGKPSKPPKK